MTTTRERVAAAVESALPARISDDLSPAEADAIADAAIRAMSEEVEAAFRDGYYAGQTTDSPDHDIAWSYSRACARLKEAGHDD